MNWSFFYDKTDKKVIKALADSRQDFKFDQQNVKARLMMALKDRTTPGTEKYRTPIHHFFPRYVAGLVTSVILVGTTAGLAYASNKAKPGERLYKVQTFQNNLVLSLPLPDTQKAQYRTDIVAQRLTELEQIQPAGSQNSQQIQAEIRASQQSIVDAVSNVAIIQSQSRQNDSKILAIVKQLNDLSNKHEQKMELLKNQITDAQIKAEIEDSLATIKVNREKLHKNSDSNSDE